MVDSHRWHAILKVLESCSSSKYRLDQIRSNIYQKKTKVFSAMQNLPSEIRQKLIAKFCDNFLSIEKTDEAEDANLRKVTFKGKDGARFETVLIRNVKQRQTIQLSSQAGCAFGCGFCGTGKVGFKRQLTVDEITDQILYFQQQSEKLGNILFSGMGEPLANPHLFDALKLLHNPDFYGFSARRIYISTIGILPGIKKLNDIFPQENLSFSLNSPFTEERTAMIPANRMYPISEVFDLLDERLLKAKRRIRINYLLIAGVNDSKEHAKALVELIRRRHLSIRHLYHISVVQLNPVKSIEAKYQAADSISAEFFKAILLNNSISCSIQKLIGETLNAGFGQLDAGYEAFLQGELFGMRRTFR